MLKNIVRIEFTVADKIYHLTCDSDSPIEHIKEALFQMQKYVGQIEDNIKAQLAAQKEAEKPVEPAAPNDESTITEV